MGFLSAYSGTVVLYLGERDRGYWVELKKYISQGDKEKAESALTSGKMVTEPGTGQGKYEVEPNVARYRQLMVLGHIKSWNLDEENGTIWPVDLTHVRRLPGPEFDRIWKTIDAFDEELTPEERRQFPDEGVSSDQDGI